MTVVHITKAPFTHYIGRGNKRFLMVSAGSAVTASSVGSVTKNPPLLKVVRNHNPVHGAGLPDSPLRNPYLITIERPRSKVIEVFEIFARRSLMEEIRKLPADAILGCWCSPEACHGDVIVKLWNEIHELEPVAA